MLKALEHKSEAFEDPDFETVTYISATASDPSSALYIQKLKEFVPNLVILSALPPAEKILRHNGAPRLNSLVLIDDLGFELQGRNSETHAPPSILQFFLFLQLLLP